MIDSQKELRPLFLSLLRREVFRLCPFTFYLQYASIACRASAARETAMPIMSMPESRSEYCR